MMNQDNNGLFNGLFGKIAPGMCRLTMNGNIAVKCNNNVYKTYNIKTGNLTNVTNFCFNIGEEFFFVMPTNKVKVGDIILVKGKPVCVIEPDKKNIKVIDYENSEIKYIVPDRHVFMGNLYYFGKIISLFGNNLKGNNITNFLKLKLMTEFFGKGNSNNSGDFSQMLPMMMLMGSFNGKDNPLNSMFDELSLEPLNEDEDEDNADNEFGEIYKNDKDK